MAKTNIIGADTIAKNITKFTEGFIAEVNRDFKSVRDLIRDRVVKNASLTDHSLADLAEMGHPYSAAHPANPHEPPYLVHTQGGELLSGIYDGTSDASVSGGNLRAEAHVGVSESVAHAVFVIMGTSKMIPRDFLTGSLEEIREQIIETLSRSLHNAVISFNGESIKL